MTDDKVESLIDEGLVERTIDEPGTYYERNYFPEDIEFLNKELGGRVLFIDNATAKDVEAVAAIHPYDTELTQDLLIHHVKAMCQDGWTLLLSAYDRRQVWRGLLGRALYKQMQDFRTFDGVTQDERRNVHFFMIKKTAQFKRNIRRLQAPVDADKLKRLICITEDDEEITLYTGDDVNPILKSILQ
jgi:dihydrodipicolinate synthase/N-acetylneuraminate lyase